MCIRDRYLKTKILNCEYRPNEFLNEQKLCAEMGNISRTPMRDALGRLEQEGLITILPKKGLMVSGITEEDVHSMFEMRLLVEPYALRTYGNLLVTMVLGGLWHGAAIRFILWGTLHGVALALHKLWMAVVPGAKATGAQMHWWSRAAGVFFTFNLVCLGWLMFRAESMQTVSLMLHQIFENFNAAMIPQVVTGYAAVFALIAAGYILHLLPSAVDAVAQRIVVHAPLVLQVLMAAAMIWCVMQIKSSDIQPFIYFQF